MQNIQGASNATVILKMGDSDALSGASIAFINYAFISIIIARARERR